MISSLMVTLWPTMPHFRRYAGMGADVLAGIRLNSAMIGIDELYDALSIVGSLPKGHAPCYFDVKGRQLRVAEIIENANYLELRLNHPIKAQTPATVLFKAGSDPARLVKISEDGKRLLFDRNPRWSVRVGESLHFPEGVDVIAKSIFTEFETQKINLVRNSGLIRRWFLSYVESIDDIDQFHELVAPYQYDELLLKIESPRGLDFAREWGHKLGHKIHLTAATGDLYVEVPQPHDILESVQTIVKADPNAVMASRMFLSVCRTPSTHLANQVRKLAERYPDAAAEILRTVGESVAPRDPDFADFAQVEWLKAQGYKRFMLCDELCLHEKMLDVAVGAFHAVNK